MLQFLHCSDFGLIGSVLGVAWFFRGCVHGVRCPAGHLFLGGYHPVSNVKTWWCCQPSWPLAASHEAATSLFPAGLKHHRGHSGKKTWPLFQLWENLNATAGRATDVHSQYLGMSALGWPCDGLLEELVNKIFCVIFIYTIMSGYTQNVFVLLENIPDGSGSADHFCNVPWRAFRKSFTLLV